MSSRRDQGKGSELPLLMMEEVKMLPTMEYCGLLQLSSSPPFDLGGKNREVELRDKSVLLHPTDWGDFISCCHNDNKEIGCTNLHSVALVDCAYDEDYHDYNNRDALSQSRGLGRGLCNVCPPPTKDDGEGEENGGNDYAHCFNQRTCSICLDLDEYKLHMHLHILPCQHTFHSNCIFPWLTKRSPMCLLCKAMFKAVQCKINNVGDRVGAAMMAMTCRGSGATKGDNSTGALTL